MAELPLPRAQYAIHAEENQVWLLPETPERRFDL